MPSKLAVLGIAGPAAGGGDGEEELRGTVEEAAARYGLDPEFLSSVIEWESRWNPKAVGPKNRNGTFDVGITQINSRTSERMGVDPMYWRDHPAEAINYTAKRLSDSLAKYGSRESALIEYNAGAGAFSRGVPESTRTQYVPGVMAIYGRRRGATPAPADVLAATATGEPGTVSKLSELGIVSGGPTAAPTAPAVAPARRGTVAVGEPRLPLPEGGLYPPGAVGLFNPYVASLATRGGVTGVGVGGGLDLGLDGAGAEVPAGKLAALGIGPQELGGIRGYAAAFGRGFARPLTPLVRYKYGTEVRPDDYDADVTAGEHVAEFAGDAFSWSMMLMGMGAIAGVVAPEVTLGLGIAGRGGKAARLVLPKVGARIVRPAVATTLPTSMLWFGLQDVDPRESRREMAKDFAWGAAEGAVVDLGFHGAVKGVGMAARRLFRNPIPEMAKTAAEPLTTQERMRAAMAGAQEKINETWRRAHQERATYGEVRPETMTELLNYRQRMRRMGDALYEFETHGGGQTEFGKNLVNWTFQQQARMAEQFGIEGGAGALERVARPAPAPREQLRLAPGFKPSERVREVAAEPIEPRAEAMPVAPQVQAFLPSAAQSLAAREGDLVRTAAKLKRLEGMIGSATREGTPLPSAALSEADRLREQVTYLRDVVAGSRAEGTIAGSYKAGAARVIRQLERTTTPEEVAALQDEASRLRGLYDEAVGAQARHPVEVVVDRAKRQPAGLGIVRTRDLEGAAESFFKRQREVGKDLVWATRKVPDGTEVLFGSKSAMAGGVEGGPKALTVSEQRLSEFKKSGFFKGMMVDYNGKPMEVLSLPDAKGRLRLRPQGSKVSKFGAEGVVTTHESGVSRPLFPSMGETLPEQEATLLKEFGEAYKTVARPKDYDPVGQMMKEFKRKLAETEGEVKRSSLIIPRREIAGVQAKLSMAQTLAVRTNVGTTPTEAIQNTIADMRNLTVESARAAGWTRKPPPVSGTDLQMNDLAREHGAVLDLGGLRAIYGQGTISDVNLGPLIEEAQKRFGSKTLLAFHSHPYAGTFSPSDIRGIVGSRQFTQRRPGRPSVEPEVLVWPDGRFQALDARGVDDIRLMALARDLQDLFIDLRNMRLPIRIVAEEYNKRAPTIIRAYGLKLQDGTIPQSMLFGLATLLGVEFTREGVEAQLQ